VGATGKRERGYLNCFNIKEEDGRGVDKRGK
jgi:hypothetical protein